MRVAFVAACPFPVPRGTPIRIYRLAEALARRGHQMHVVAYHLGEPIEAPPFRIHRTPSVSTYRRLSPGPSYQKLLVMDPLLRHKLASVIRRFAIEIVHAHHYEGLLAACTLPRDTRRPLVYDAHTLLESELAFYRLGIPQPVKRALGRWFDRRLPRHADRVVAVSETIRAGLVAHGLDGTRISVIPNGVEADRFVPANEAATTPSNPPAVVFAGNLATYQGIEYLLQAFATVAAARPDVELRIVSSDPFDRHEPLAGSLGIRHRIRVIASDFDRLAEHLSAATLAVSPRTVCDGLPQKVLNYMAAGLPTVAFAGSAVTLEHGATGLVVADGDTDALAAAVLQLLADPALVRRLGACARHRVLTEHSWDRAASRVETLYRELID